MTSDSPPVDTTLDELLNEHFAGRVVRKDLTKLVKEGANVPVYVLEYLLGNYCASNDPAVIEELLRTELNYPQANGTIELRERIAALYPGATPDNVLVTVGCIEANFISLQTLLTAGDELVMMMPNYTQIWGLGRNLGLEVKSFHLEEERGWAPDLDELNEVVSEKTKLIAICNPNNPTGSLTKFPLV